MTLFERLENKLQEHPETMRACVELAKAWRLDKFLRRLEATMIVCDKNVSLTLTGNGDVIVPDDGIIGDSHSPACIVPGHAQPNRTNYANFDRRDWVRRVFCHCCRSCTH